MKSTNSSILYSVIKNKHFNVNILFSGFLSAGDYLEISSQIMHP